MYEIVKQLERIADEYKYLCDELSDNGKTALSKEILNLFEEINAFFDTFYRMFYKFDPKLKQTKKRVE